MIVCEGNVEPVKKQPQRVALCGKGTVTNLEQVINRNEAGVETTRRWLLERNLAAKALRQTGVRVEFYSGLKCSRPYGGSDVVENTAKQSCKRLPSLDQPFALERAP